MKTVIKKMAAHSGLLHLCNAATAKKMTIFFYHGFYDRHAQPDERLGKKLLSIDLFEQHLRTFRRYGQPCSLLDLIHPSSLPRNPVMVTLDDGYANNYDLAFPLLKKYQIPVTIFLTTGFIDRRTLLWVDWLEGILAGTDQDHVTLNIAEKPMSLDLSSAPARQQSAVQLKALLKRQPIAEIHASLRHLQNVLHCSYGWDQVPASRQPLSWPQIREMQASGLVTFGGHTHSHLILAQSTLEAQQREIISAKQRIEKELGEFCPLFAYPNGKPEDYTPQTIDLLKQCGYQLAVTTELGYDLVHHHDRFRLKRWGADISPLELAYILSGAPLLF